MSEFLLSPPCGPYPRYCYPATPSPHPFIMRRARLLVRVNETVTVAHRHQKPQNSLMFLLLSVPTLSKIPSRRIRMPFGQQGDSHPEGSSYLGRHTFTFPASTNGGLRNLQGEKGDAAHSRNTLPGSLRGRYFMLCLHTGVANNPHACLPGYWVILQIGFYWQGRWADVGSGIFL